MILPDTTLLKVIGEIIPDDVLDTVFPIKSDTQTINEIHTLLLEGESIPDDVLEGVIQC